MRGNWGQFYWTTFPTLETKCDLSILHSMKFKEILIKSVFSFGHVQSIAFFQMLSLLFTSQFTTSKLEPDLFNEFNILIPLDNARLKARNEKEKLTWSPLNLYGSFLRSRWHAWTLQHWMQNLSQCSTFFYSFIPWPLEYPLLCF